MESRDRQGAPATQTLEFVPPEVLGAGAGYAAEPRWEALPQMPFMQFYHGLRQRNWTSPYYTPAAAKWDLQFFQDRCGRAGGWVDGRAPWSVCVCVCLPTCARRSGGYMHPIGMAAGSPTSSLPHPAQNHLLSAPLRPLPCPAPSACSGRFLRPSFGGYRVLVTQAAAGGAAGQQQQPQQWWVNLEEPGAPTFLRDYSGGGGKGAIHAAKRESMPLGHPADVSEGACALSAAAAAAVLRAEGRRGEPVPLAALCRRVGAGGCC